MLPGMVAFAYYDATRNFLNGFGKTTVTMVLQILVTILHYYILYFFVKVLGMNHNGIGYATSITDILLFVVIHIYLQFDK